VRADPNPRDGVILDHRHGPEMLTDAGGPKRSLEGFEAKGRVPRIELPEPKILERESLDVLGQRVVALPKVGRRLRSQGSEVSWPFRASSFAR